MHSETRCSVKEVSPLVCLIFWRKSEWIGVEICRAGFVFCAFYHIQCVPKICNFAPNFGMLWWYYRGEWIHWILPVSVTATAAVCTCSVQILSFKMAQFFAVFSVINWSWLVSGVEVWQNLPGKSRALETMLRQSYSAFVLFGVAKLCKERARRLELNFGCADKSKPRQNIPKRLSSTQTRTARNSSHPKTSLWGQPFLTSRVGSEPACYGLWPRRPWSLEGQNMPRRRILQSTAS